MLVFDFEGIQANVLTFFLRVQETPSPRRTPSSSSTSLPTLRMRTVSSHTPPSSTGWSERHKHLFQLYNNNNNNHSANFNLKQNSPFLKKKTKKKNLFFSFFSFFCNGLEHMSFFIIGAKKTFFCLVRNYFLALQIGYMYFCCDNNNIMKQQKAEQQPHTHRRRKSS